MEERFAEIPNLPQMIWDYVKHSENLFVLGVNQSIDEFNELLKNIPNKYEWQFRTVDGFKHEFGKYFATTKDAYLINKFYWTDMLDNWKAYSFMNICRTEDLIRSCVWALARRDIVCASLVARSALETVVQFIDTSRSVAAAIGGSSVGLPESALINPEVDLHQVIVASNDLEKLSLKTIFASRSADDVEELYRPTNILTILNRMTKLPDQQSLSEIYNVLCEVAHPNFLGRSLYIHKSKKGKIEGTEVRTVARGLGPSWQKVAEVTVAAFSWSCRGQVSGFKLLSETLDLASSRFAE